MVLVCVVLDGQERTAAGSFSNRANNHLVLARMRAVLAVVQALEALAVARSQALWAWVVAQARQVMAVSLAMMQMMASSMALVWVEHRQVEFRMQMPRDLCLQMPRVEWSAAKVDSVPDMGNATQSLPCVIVNPHSLETFVRDNIVLVLTVHRSAPAMAFVKWDSASALQVGAWLQVH